MEPSDPVDSLWVRQEPPCAIHGMGPCPYPVAQRQPVFTSPGEGGGEEGVTEEEEDEVVVVAVVDKDDETIKVIPVPESMPLRPPYKQTARIRIDPRGRPIGTLAPRMGAREANPDSLESGSAVWPPPPPPPSRTVTTTPPPPSSGTSSTALPPQDTAAASEPPPLWSPIGGRILRRFTHLAKLSRLGHRPGAWDLP
jgi:hypothetical protein